LGVIGDASCTGTDGGSSNIGNYTGGGGGGHKKDDKALAVAPRPPVAVKSAAEVSMYGF